MSNHLRKALALIVLLLVVPARFAKADRGPQFCDCDTVKFATTDWAAAPPAPAIQDEPVKVQSTIVNFAPGVAVTYLTVAVWVKYTIACPLRESQHCGIQLIPSVKNAVWANNLQSIDVPPATVPGAPPALHATTDPRFIEMMVPCEEGCDNQEHVKRAQFLFTLAFRGSHDNALDGSLEFELAWKHRDPTKWNQPPCTNTARPWKMILAIKNGGLDQKASDYDGDTRLNRDDKTPQGASKRFDPNA
jgi:hypothetical protein